MATVISPACQANVPHNAANAPSGNQNPLAMPPDFFELVVEVLVFRYCPELTLMGWVFFERPIRGRCNY